MDVDGEEVLGVEGPGTLLVPTAGPEQFQPLVGAVPRLDVVERQQACGALQPERPEALVRHRPRRQEQQRHLVRGAWEPSRSLLSQSARWIFKILQMGKSLSCLCTPCEMLRSLAKFRNAVRLDG